MQALTRSEIETYYRTRVPVLVREAIQRGWNVIPCNGDKRPRIKWKRFQTERVTLRTTEHWQRQFQPEYWAAITGAISDLVCIDFDVKPDSNGKPSGGDRSLAKIGLEPHTVTRSGGWHLYLRYPAGKHVKTIARPHPGYPGLDCRGHGGYFLINGPGYEALRCHDDLEPWENLPGDLRGRLIRRNTVPASVSITLPTAGERVAIQKLIERAVSISPGARNQAGLWLASQLRDNGYSRNEAAAAMRQHQQAVDSVRDRYTWEEARATLVAVYSRPARAPWRRGAV